MTSETSRSPDSRLGSSTPQNAAIQGASLAFSKPMLKPKPQADTHNGRDGALAAAAKVGSPSPPRSVSRSRYQGPNEPRLISQSTGDGNPSGRRGDSQQRGFNRLEPGNRPVYPSRSPSFIAATLAASRSGTPNHTGQLQSPPGQQQNTFLRRPLAAPLRNVSSRESLTQGLDTTPIAPTTSLIDQFEQKRAIPAKLLKEGSDLRRSSTSATQRSPRPPESQKPPQLYRARTPSPVTAKPQWPKPEIKSPKPTSPATFSGIPKALEPSSPPPFARKPSVISPKQVRPLKSPQPPKSPNLFASRSPSIAAPKRVDLPVEIRKPLQLATKPIPIPTKFPLQSTGDSYASSDDSFVSASDGQPSLPPSRHGITSPHRRLTSPSAATIDSLATAIVASSLASSRAASPSKSLSTAPIPPPPRRSPRGHIFHHHNEDSRTPSPAKGPQLRTTMRKPQQEHEESDRRRGRKHLMKKPHKHHEGDRKRWRDEITERERKRYEAVWASNKGLYTLLSFDGGNEVSNIVVRDIWSRSRLPPEVLEEVYALVDRKGQGALGKEEFVVGLWLVDQRLKGRKLPIRVTESVWRSVGILGGIKVKKAK